MNEPAARLDPAGPRDHHLHDLGLHRDAAARRGRPARRRARDHPLAGSRPAGRARRQARPRPRGRARQDHHRRRSLVRDRHGPAPGPEDVRRRGRPGGAARHRVRPAAAGRRRLAREGADRRSSTWSRPPSMHRTPKRAARPRERPRSTFGVSAPTALIMAAGEGTRMRSARPKVLHEVCGRPMVAWPIRAAREAGARAVCVIVSPDRDLSPRSRRGRDDRPARGRRHRRGAARGARGDRASRDGRRPLGRPPADLRARSIAELIATHRDVGRRRHGDDHRARRPRLLRADRARRRRTRSSASSRRRSPATRPPRSWRSGRSTPAPTPSRARPWPTRSHALGNDNAQGEYYLGDVLPLMREAGLEVVAYRAPTTQPSTSGSTTASSWHA